MVDNASKITPNGGAAAQGNLSDVTSHAAGLALLNAVNAQQQGYILASQTVTATVARILAGQPTPTAVETAAKLVAPSPAAAPTPEAVASDACYAMVSQAWAMAAQDAAAYLRYTEIVATAAIGVALDTMTRGVTDGDPSQTIAAANSCVVAALRNLDEVSAAAAKTIKDFPRAS